MLGTKFYKGKFDDKAYHVAAEWCEPNNAMIVDKGNYYEVVKIPAPSLNELKTIKIEKLKERRNAEEVVPIEWNGNLYDYDSDSRERMRAKRQDIEDKGGTGKILWTLADNEQTEIGLDDFKGINSVAAERSEALHNNYNSLKAKVEAAASKEELENIIW